MECAILVIKCCIPLLHYIMLFYQVHFHYFQKCTYKMDIRIFLNKNTKDKDNISEILDIILTNM